MAATMKDIAQKTGLGLATISSYLNGGNVREKNRLAIEQAIEELHFEVNEVARGLKTKRTKTIGVVIPELSNLFCTAIITVIEDILRSHGYATMVCDCRTDPALEAEAVEFLLRKMVDGIINIPVTPDGSHLLPAIQKGKPVVLVDRMIQGLACDTVVVDNTNAAKRAVEELLHAGHRRIGMLSGPQEMFTAKERLLGYHQAFLENGLVPRDEWVVCGHYTMEGGRQGAVSLLQQDLTALFVSNYEMTVGAVIALNQAGKRIPQELSLIGFDNPDFAHAVTPALTIVTQPTTEIGEQAARLILARLQEADRPLEHLRLQTAMMMGQSVRTCSA